MLQIKYKSTTWLLFSGFLATLFLMVPHAFSATDKLDSTQLQNIPNDWQLMKQVRNEVWRNAIPNYWDLFSCRLQTSSQEVGLEKFFFACMDNFNQRCQKENDSWVVEQIQTTPTASIRISTLFNCQMRPLIQEVWQFAPNNQFTYESPELPWLFFFQFNQAISKSLNKYQVTVWDEDTYVENMLEFRMGSSASNSFKSLFLLNGREFLKVSQNSSERSLIEVVYEFPFFNNSYKILLTLDADFKLPVEWNFFVLTRQYKQVDLMKFRSDLNNIFYIYEHFGGFKEHWRNISNHLLANE